MRNIVRLVGPIALPVLTLAACADAGAPATRADAGASGIDSIVIERTRVLPPHFLAVWPDTVEKRIGMVVRVFSKAPPPAGSYVVHLGADGGSIVDRDSVTVAVRDSASFTWTLGTRSGVQRVTATASGRSANFALQVQPGIADTLVMTAPIAASVRAGDTITLPAFQLADRFMNPVRLVGAEVLVYGRFADARQAVDAANAGEFGRISATTDSTGKATLPPVINRGPVGQSHIELQWSAFVPIEIPVPDGSNGGALGIGGVTRPTVLTMPGPPIQLSVPFSLRSFGIRGSTILVDIVVMDMGANPLPNVGVNVSVVSGVGSAPPFVVSDSAGVAHVPFTLQPEFGANTLVFSAPWLQPCPRCYTFSVYGI